MSSAHGGRIAQLVTYLTADPGVASLIPAQSNTLEDIIPRRSRRDIVLASSVRPSGTISQYLLVRFDLLLVQMISTMDSQTSNKFGQNQPLNT